MVRGEKPVSRPKPVCVTPYASQSGVVDLLSRNNAVEGVSLTNIPASKGVTQDDNQPYPVFGWLELNRVQPVIHPTP